jgi:hypothetical protein
MQALETALRLSALKKKKASISVREQGLPDCVIPNLQSTAALDLANDPV